MINQKQATMDRDWEHPVLANRLLQQRRFLLKLPQTDNHPIQNPKSKIQNGMLPRDWRQRSRLSRVFWTSAAASRTLFPLSLLCLALSTANLKANAQIIPDHTLGNENSIVTPINSQSERIDGGAIRGANLFHSFQEFSIKEGHSAYFANSEIIQTIFSRVTGNNPSLLFGTLGVLGNANLFFINPNGIIFGANSSLDIRGSFVGSTANSMVFPDGNKFSATNPEGVPLLTINVPVPVGLQFEGDSSGTIINGGDLAVGKHLTLIGGTIVSIGNLSALNGKITLFTVAGGVSTEMKLDETGKVFGERIEPLGEPQTSPSSLSEFVLKNGEKTGLTVNSEGQVTLAASQATVKTGDIIIAGSSDKISLQAQTAKLDSVQDLTLLESQIGTIEDLNLLAKDTVRIRDSLANPFVAVAGGNLLIQGNESIDIFALNHPASGLVSGREMILRSPNPISGDAHYWSGGNFRIENLSGNLGGLFSISDPVIRTKGDVLIGAYKGTSLHILAVGKIEIPQFIWITGADPNYGLVEIVTLSNGQQIDINGKTEPTVDLRAGMLPQEVGIPFGSGMGNFYSPLSFPDTASSADINVGLIIFRDAANINNKLGGKVLLTNQYKPNPNLTGNITSNAIFNTGVFAGTAIETGSNNGGGLVAIDSRNALTINGSIIANSLAKGGNVFLHSGGNILINNNSEINVRGGGEGNININAKNLELTQGTLTAGIAPNLGDANTQAGDININVTENVKINQGFIVNDLWNGSQGQGGSINITAKSLELLNGDNNRDTFSLIGVRNIGGKGNTGDININTQTVKIDGYPNQINNDIVFRTIKDAQGNEITIRGEGNAGNIVINTNSLEILNYGSISSNLSNATGTGGSIIINAKDKVIVDGDELVTVDGKVLALGSNIIARVQVGGKGKAGNIEINTPSLELTNGGFISANTQAEGDAGSIKIKADRVLVAGETRDGGNVSYIDSSVQTTLPGLRSIGHGGAVTIETKSLELLNGGQILAVTFGEGDAGGIAIKADKIVIDGIGTNSVSGIGTTAEVGSIGNAGNTTIETNTLTVTNGGDIGAGPKGEGNGGNIQITARESILVDGEDVNGRASIISNSVKGKGNAGILELNTNSLTVSNGAQILASTFAEGNAGEMKIKTGDLIVTGFKKSSGISSQISASVDDEARGSGGAINIDSKNLSLTNGGLISTMSFGQGNAGLLNINAKNITIDGETGQNFITGISSSSNLIGNGGNIDINTDSLRIARGGAIQANTYGEGNAGLLKITAQNITLDGEDSQGSSSLIQSQIGENAKGNAGEISINTKKLTLTNGGGITGSTFGIGNGANIEINAAESSFDGKKKNQEFGSGVFSRVADTSTGNGGSVNLTSNKLSLTNGAEINLSTKGKGNAGSILILNASNVSVNSGSQITTAIKQGGEATQPSDITINTQVLTLDGGEITASTSGKGDTGEINLTASDSINLSNGKISSAVNTNAVGNSRQITINTPLLNLINNSTISVATEGMGNAGSITFNTQKLTVQESSKILGFTNSAGEGGFITINAPNSVTIDSNSQLSVETTDKGKAGNITISTDTLTLGRDSQLSATATKTSTNQQGGGSITLNASNLNISGKLGIFAETQSIAPAGSLNLQPDNGKSNLNIVFSDNGFISARTSATGQGGNINLSAPNIIDIKGQGKITTETGGEGNAGVIGINTQQLNLSEGVEISAATTGKGNAGNIHLNANQISLNNAQISATTSGGKGGSIDVTANSFNLTKGSQLRTTTSGNNNAGDITLNIRDNLTLSGENSGIFADTDLNSFGNGGKIFIDPTNFIIRDGAAVSVNSQGKGTGGDITISADFITLDKGKITAQTFSTTGGNITLHISEFLQLRNGSQISTTAGTAQAGGDGGNIDIDPVFILSNFYENNDITANAFTGKGGNITITAQGIFGLTVRKLLTPFSDITASSQFGVNGNVILNIPGIDPTRGLENLTEQAINPQIKEVCQANNGRSNAEFYNLGRGGLPQTPEDFFSADFAGTWTPWVETVPEIKLNYPSQIEENLINQNLTPYIILPCQRR